MTPKLTTLWSGKLISGGLTNQTSEGWSWQTSDGGYHKHTGFFVVHWEVHDTDEHHVRLHVEAPKYEADPALNDIKFAMVRTFTTSSVADDIFKHGFIHQLGRLTSEKSVKRNKCTEPFRVILREAQQSADAEANIAVVHAALGSYIENVVSVFRPTLDAYFSER